MQQLPVAYDPSAFRERVATQRSRVVRGFVSTGLTVLILIGVLLYVQFGRDGEAGEMLGMLTWVLTVSAVIGVLIQLAHLLWLGRLRTGLRGVGEGLAFILSSEGIRYADGSVSWDSIERVAAARGKPGHGYLLQVERADESTLDFPLEGLDILPGSLDSATRAYSSGRHGVDLSVVDD